MCVCVCVCVCVTTFLYSTSLQYGRKEVQMETLHSEVCGLSLGRGTLFLERRNASESLKCIIFFNALSATNEILCGFIVLV